MNKRDIAIAASATSGLTQRNILQAMEAIFESIIEALEEEKRISINNFGTFYTKKFEERILRDPRNGESVLVPPRKIVKFKVTPHFKSKR
jgi:nucleoid DNA-binding protein